MSVKANRTEKGSILREMMKCQDECLNYVMVFALGTGSVMFVHFVFPLISAWSLFSLDGPLSPVK